MFKYKVSDKHLVRKHDLYITLWKYYIILQWKLTPRGREHGHRPVVFVIGHIDKGYIVELPKLRDPGSR